MSVCEIDGCENASRARSMCRSHYERARRWGDATAGRLVGGDASAVLAARLDRSGGNSSCWEWNAARDSAGYGSVSIDGRTWRAHRLAWTVEHGEIPDGMYVCHRCDNPPCCNPAHLFLGEPAVNSADMDNKGRRAAVRASDHPNARLTDAQVVELRSLRADGSTLMSLAAQFGVSMATVHNVVSRRTYASVA